MEKISYLHAIAEVCSVQLSNAEVDGEAMHYVLKETGMEEQMLSQLIATFDRETIHYYLKTHNKE